MTGVPSTVGSGPLQAERQNGRDPISGSSTLDISVVIIARNEETVIARCIDSALRELQGKRGEVILVDSLSTDGTLRAAAGFPITVLQITEGALLSPSAGRYVGSNESRGRIVVFVDGDMIIAPGWFDAAVAALADSSVGAVGGWLYRVFPGEDLTQGHAVRRKGPGDVRSLGGAGAYRRDVLDACGTFHPFLRGEEERELCYRIRQAGYRIVKIDAPMAYHLEKPRTVSEINEKASYYMGMGQILRKQFFSELTRDLLHSQRHILSTGMVGVVLVVCLLLALTGMTLPLLVAAGGLVVGGGVGLFIKGPAGMLHALRRRVLPYVMLGRGMVRGLSDSSAFPLSAVRRVQPAMASTAAPASASAAPATRTEHPSSGGRHR